MARSAAYEVCPHNPEQCDTKTLILNNQAHGVVMKGVTEDSTAILLEKEGPETKVFTGFMDGFTV